jgi:hypothetical protein
MSKKLSNAHNKLYNMVYNYIIKQEYTINKTTFIIDMKDKLLSIIENSHYSNSTKESILFMIARYLEINTPDDKNIQLFKEAGYKYLQIIKNIENQNEQDETEIENYRPHNYFIDILNSINVDNIQTKIGHYQYLLLALLSYQPPLRTNFYVSAKIIRSMKENDKINNFIWISRKGSIKIFYIVNNDKVSNTKIYAMNKNLSYIKLEDTNLIKLINDSYEKYPREYLFEINDKPINQSTYLNWLRKITEVSQINNDIMRSSYVNWFYEHNKKLSDREQLAHRMRHSVLTSQRNYLKVIEPEDTKEKPEIIQTTEELKKEIDKLKEQLNKCQIDKTIDKSKYNKNRKDVIYKINIKHVIPREDTLKKYNIIYNEKLKIYE